MHQEVNHGKGQQRAAHRRRPPQQQAHRRQRRIRVGRKCGYCLRPCSRRQRRLQSITRRGTSPIEIGADIVLQGEARRIIMFDAMADSSSM